MTWVFRLSYRVALIAKTGDSLSKNDQILLDQLIAQQKAEVESELNDSEFFEVFVASKYLRPFDLSDEEILSGVTDGGQDGGIDAVYIGGARTSGWFGIS